MLLFFDSWTLNIAQLLFYTVRFSFIVVLRAFVRDVVLDLNLADITGMDSVF